MNEIEFDIMILRIAIIGLCFWIINLELKLRKFKRGLEGYDRTFIETSHFMQRLQRMENNIKKLDESFSALEGEKHE